MRPVALLSASLRWLWLALALLIVGVAVVVSLGRQLLPQVENYRQELLTRLNQELGLELSVAVVEGTWAGFNPGLVLGTAVLPRADAPQLPGVEVQRLVVELDSLRSLWAMRPLVRKVVAIEPRVHLYQDATGRWNVAGFSGGGGPGLQALQEFYDAARHVEFRRAEVVFHPAQGEPWQAGPFTADLRQGINLRQLRLAGDGPELVLESTGRLGQPDYHMAAYLRMDGFDLAPYLRMVVGELPVDSLRLDGEAWLGWGKAGGSANGSVSLRPLQVAPLFVGGGGLALDGASLDFTLTRDLANRGRLQVTDFEAWAGDARLALARWQLDWEPGARLELAAERLDLAALADIATRSGLLPAAAQQTLGQLNPRGELHLAHLLFPLDGSGKPPALRAELRDVALDPWQSAPGGAVARGYLEADTRRGKLWLDGSALRLEFPRLYAAPLEIDAVAGQVAWEVGDRIRVNSGPLRLQSRYGHGAAQVDLDLRRRSGEGPEPFMSLLIGLRDSKLAFRRSLVPNNLPAGVATWIDASVGEGSVPAVGFIYHGSLAAGAAARRSVQVMLDVTGGELAYHPDWPAVRDLNARVVVDNTTVLGQVHGARILDSTVGPGRVQVTPGRDGMRLSVAAAVAGDAADLDRLFTTSPLASSVGKVFSDWDLAGPYSATVDLRLALKAGARPLVAVEGKLAQARMWSNTLGLDFTGIDSALSYHSERGLRSDRLAAQLWGHPLRGKIASEPAQDVARVARLEVGGTLAIDDFRRWLRLSLLGLARGEAKFDGKLVIPLAAGESGSLALGSDLVGVAIDAPFPLAKEPPAAMPLVVNLPLQAGPLQLAATITGVGGVRMALGAGQPLAARAWLGEDSGAPLPVPGTFLISGAVATANVADWLQTVKRYVAIAAEREGAADGDDTSPVGDDGGAGAPRTRVVVSELAVGTLSAFGFELEAVEVGITPQDEAVEVRLDNERLHGTVTWRGAEQPIGVVLDYLDYPFQPPPPEAASEAVTGAGEAAASADTALVAAGAPAAAATLVPQPATVSTPAEPAAAPVRAQFSPADAPWLQVAVQEFRLRGRDLGQWRFELQPMAGGAHISGLEVDLPGATLRGIDREQGAQLYWREQADGSQQSWFQGRLGTADVGDLFRHFGYEPGVESKSARFLLTLAWPGNPAQFDFDTVSGNTDLLLEKGNFEQTSGTGAGALKFLGVLNFNNLLRRLQLDFSDLFSKGLSYDRMSGIIEFDPRHIILEEPLHVTGPSSDFKLTGTLDTVAETLDARLLVTLPVNENLPWMAALAGGPAIAAGVYLVGKLFEVQLDKLSTAVYQIVGPWREPEVTFLRLFDFEQGQAWSCPGGLCPPEQSAAPAEAPAGAPPGTPSGTSSETPSGTPSGTSAETPSGTSSETPSGINSPIPPVPAGT